MEKEVKKIDKRKKCQFCKCKGAMTVFNPYLEAKGEFVLIKTCNDCYEEISKDV